MTDLKIRVFKGAESEPETTVAIPDNLLKVARKLIPKQAAAALQDEGIDLDEPIKLSTNPEIKGTLVVIEEHGKSEKIEISPE
ncbi:MAG: hypothetical protein J7M20_05515 [Deltaproteobacteria bacterium]|nr:hypothetical protein [Deltaproteobacteria bacterium]